jgi:hypothetical protein
MRKRTAKKLLLGLGFDQTDEDARLTRGENFELYGGSKLTHEQMQEKATKFNEELEKKHKTMDSVSAEDFQEIALKLDMPLLVRPSAGLVSNN